ncbi:hypothetical protein Q1695_003347 [Nippostrongylus brasiliensis]|nr:hypothetical protein Q1695_003347 [Nippostrongylus brasiliensis]
MNGGMQVLKAARLLFRLCSPLRRSISHVVAEEIDHYCDPSSPKSLNYEHIHSARKNIDGAVVRTPCWHSQFLSRAAGCDVYLKMENLQHTGSFKDRGARNMLMCLAADERKKGVVTASAGNFARALSYHGKELGIPVTVVLPRSESLTTVSQCATFGATVTIEEDNHLESLEAAVKLIKESGAKFVNGHDNLDVMAGGGTVACEILEELKDVDAIFVPVLTGGLLAATVVASKKLSPKTKVIGLETSSCPTLQLSVAAERPTSAGNHPSFVESPTVRKAGCNAFHTVREGIDGLVAVKEPYIGAAVTAMLAEERIVLEGAGALGPAAILARSFQGLRGKRVVCILTGGNIDSTVIGRTAEKGLAFDNRLVHLEVFIPDNPDGFSEFFEIFDGIGSRIVEVRTDTTFNRLDTNSIRCKVVAETNSIDQMISLNEAVVGRYGRFSSFSTLHSSKRIDL